MARRLISLLPLALLAISCGVSGGYGTAQRFQDGIYYKGFDKDMQVAEPLSEEDFQRLAAENIRKEQHNAVPNGIIALKGGELAGEIASMRNISTVWELSDFFEEEYFKTKKVVHVAIVAKK